jgi:hypothetical protein
MMSERTIIAVVSDLLKTGLTVEQQILVNELVIVAGELQAKASFRAGLEAGWDDAEAARKEANAERMRVCRTVHNVQHTPSPSPPMINNSTPLSPPPIKPAKTPLDEPLFEEFWGVYPLKVGKGAARKAFRHALTRGSSAEILAGAKRYAASRPEPKFTAHASTWLNADRWLDEHKVVEFRNPAQRTWAEIKADKERQQSP